MGAGSPLYVSRTRGPRRNRSPLITLGIAAGLFLLVCLLLGLAFAGSRQELAEGTHVAGVDVGGLTQLQAVAKLNRAYSRVAAKPVTFAAGDDEFAFAANQLGVEPDWRAAVAAAARAGDGFGPIRGFRRLHARVFGAEVLPRLEVSGGALEYALDRISGEVNRRPRSASLVRRGLRFEIRPEKSGRRLDRAAAARTVVRSLGSLDRSAGPVTLPVSVKDAQVTADMLMPALRRARVAVSASVRLRAPRRSWNLPRWRIAHLLLLPSNGRKRLAIAGPRADAYFHALSERVGKPPVNATFAASGETIGIVPSKPGTKLDVLGTARALLRAATSAANRVADLSIVRAYPELTTKEAQSMGIDRRMSTYKTWNSGTWDRITNLRLGVQALDGTLVSPGGTFSLNEAIGERTEERGFRPAPVIIGTRYEEEVGGGTSQVATTVFNAAWEAGLEITERNPHSLYISRYETGRDATVYWPSLDLKFVNDTKTWVLVKGFAEPDGIRVSVYGGEERRVESSEGTLSVTGPVPVRRVKDASLFVGETVVEQSGTAPTRSSVTRTIYAADGTLLDEETWTTSYRGEPRIIHIGTKVKEPPKPPPKDPKPPEDPPEDPKTPPRDGPTPPPTRP